MNLTRHSTPRPSSRQPSRAAGGAPGTLSGGACRRSPLLIAILASQALAQAPASSSSAAAGPAQQPLLNPAQALIKPNLMVTIDDSYSMGLEYMPDKSIRIGSWTVEKTPAASRSACVRICGEGRVHMGRVLRSAQAPLWKRVLHSSRCHCRRFHL